VVVVVCTRHDDAVAVLALWQSDIGDITFNIEVIDGLIKLFDPLVTYGVDYVLSMVSFPVPSFPGVTLSSPQVRPRRLRCLWRGCGVCEAGAVPCPAWAQIAYFPGYFGAACDFHIDT
jgi:hypothetical protein